jgi:hypothetical protein
MIRKVSDPESRHEDGPEYTPPGDSYMWFEMGFFTRWDSPDECKVLCTNTPKELPSELQIALGKQPSLLDFKDPFAMHLPLIDQIILLYEVSVWRVRDPVRQIEKVSLDIMLHGKIVDEFQLGRPKRRIQF